MLVEGGRAAFPIRELGRQAGGGQEKGCCSGTRDSIQIRGACVLRSIPTVYLAVAEQDLVVER